jgi:FKBP-type peptidyl-prolyl cis-trans isomerase FkpA
MYLAPPAVGEPPQFLFSQATERDASRFVLGAKMEREGVLPGISAAVRGMRAGGRRKAVVPPALGFGAAGKSQRMGLRTITVPPNATLLFFLELPPGIAHDVSTQHEEL